MKEGLKSQLKKIERLIKSDKNSSLASQRLTEKVFLAKEIGPSSRMLTYFDEQDLLLTDRDKNGGWRKFCFIEFVWIKLIEELSSLNLPLDNMIKLKEYFHEVSIPLDMYEGDPARFEKFNNQRVYDKFHQLLSFCISERMPLAIKIDKDGVCAVDYGVKRRYTGILKPTEASTYKYNTYISVSVSNILQKCLETLSFDNISNFQLVNDNELEVLRAMREDQVKSLEITLPTGKKKKFSISTTKDGNLSPEQVEEITSLLSMRNYDKFTLNKRSDMTIYYEQKRKIK